VPAGTDNDLTVASAAAFNRAAIELAGKLATPQTIANVFYVTQAMAELKR